MAAAADDGVEGVGGAHPIPLDYVCPITQELMRDPTIALDGHSYERDAIIEWFGRSGTTKSPLTGVSLESSHLTPNHTLRKGEQLLHLRSAAVHASSPAHHHSRFVHRHCRSAVAAAAATSLPHPTHPRQ